MSKGNQTEMDILGLYLNGTPIANIADNASVAPLANLFIRFHTADPGEAGTQATSEANFTGYAATPIARTPGSPQWTVSSPGGVGTAQNANALTGPTYTQGAGAQQIITHWSVGVAAAGATKIIISGALTNQIIMNPGIAMTIAAGALTWTED
jgi:hypothetical protein